MQSTSWETQGEEYLHAEYIMRNAGLEEAQAAIKISGRNINNLRNTDGTAFIEVKRNGRAS